MLLIPFALSKHRRQAEHPSQLCRPSSSSPTLISKSVGMHSSISNHVSTSCITRWPLLKNTRLTLPLCMMHCFGQCKAKDDENARSQRLWNFELAPRPFLLTYEFVPRTALLSHGTFRVDYTRTSAHEVPSSRPSYGGRKEMKTWHRLRTEICHWRVRVRITRFNIF